MRVHHPRTILSVDGPNGDSRTRMNRTKSPASRTPPTVLLAIEMNIIEIRIIAIRPRSAVLTRQGERPLDYERRPYVSDRRPSRGRQRYDRQSRFRGARSYQPREFDRYNPHEPEGYQPRESIRYEPRGPRGDEPREPRRPAERETSLENSDYLNSQRACPFN